MHPHSLHKNNQWVEYQPPFVSPVELLDHWVRKDGNKTALVFDAGQPDSTITWSYAELGERIKSCAQYLVEQVSEDEKQVSTVAFCFENTPEILLLNYASWSLGWVSVPLDSTRDSTERKIYKLQQTGAKVLFTRSNQETKAENKLIQAALPELKIVTVESWEVLKTADAKQATVWFDPAFGGVTMTAQGHHDTSEAPALILYTSGTTALPKGAILTWSSLLANAQSIADWLKFSPSDRWLVVMPLHHINSTTFALTTLLAGGTIVLVPKYSKSHFWSILAKYKCTGTSIVPTIAFDQLSETAAFEKHKTNLTQLTRMQLGSAPVQPTSVRQFVDQFGVKLVQGYGQTETSLRSTGVPYPTTEKEYNWAIASNTLGTELTYTNVTVLNEDGRELPADEVGEICVRGPIIMQEYLANQPATEEAFAHQWFHSGDTGYWQEHFGKRYFFLKGRSKEIIKKGGVLISPLAIENTLLASYADLDQAYVIGIPDARMGEEIGLIAVGKPGVTATILADAKSGRLTSLQPYEYPVAAIEMTEDQLPKTSTGKVQRVELRQLYAHQLLLQSLHVAATKTHVFRRIDTTEAEILHQAVTINNQRWGMHLAASEAEFADRAAHGVLIGVFAVDKPDQLLGTVSGIQLRAADLEQASNPTHWSSTWEGITDHGRLLRHTPKGDCLVWVAISVQGKPNQSAQPPKQSPPPDYSDILSSLDPALTASYIQSGQDPVLSFHQQAKAGLATGATVKTIIPHGRPADWEACGYSVLLDYPPLSSNNPPRINPSASLGTQLLESAFVYAHSHHIYQLFAYSRPAGLYQFVQNSHQSAG